MVSLLKLLLQCTAAWNNNKFASRYVLTAKKVQIRKLRIGDLIWKDITLEDMGELETQMMKIGTYFIHKMMVRDVNAYIDRLDLMQDLFEFTHKFLEAKRKVIVVHCVRCIISGGILLHNFMY